MASEMTWIPFSRSTRGMPLVLLEARVCFGTRIPQACRKHTIDTETMFFASGPGLFTSGIRCYEIGTGFLQVYRAVVSTSTYYANSTQLAKLQPYDRHRAVRVKDL
jgi:hypothetical protein